jgi:E3 Ubiquitin ligase
LVLEFPVSTSGADTFWLSLVALVGVAVGVFLFFRGFRMLQYKRLILNTPSSKIRSASMGLVEVSGMPTGPKTISSAITGAPCYYYRARAWQWIDNGKGGSWRQAVDESVFVPFFLEDNTGKVLVNPQGAALDVHRSFYDEFYTVSVMKNNPFPESIRKFVATRGLLAGEKVRLEEYTIKPGYPLFVFGTLGENTAANSWNPQPHVPAERVSVGLSIGHSGLNFTRGTNLSGLAAKAVSGLLERGSTINMGTTVYTSRSNGGTLEVPQELLNKLNQAGVEVPFPLRATSQQETVSMQMGEGAGMNANSMQVAIAADPHQAQELQRPATTEQSGIADKAFDLHSPAAIGKGERGDPFTISSQSQREVVQALGWKSTVYIWGGPLFALVCLYCLFVFWGWI